MVYSSRDDREFLLSLVELSIHSDPEQVLKRALTQLVALSRAREGYVELRAETSESRLRWCATEGCDATREHEIRTAVSTGIVAEAVATGETIVTASALADPRFRELGSVREHAIEAVICAPIGVRDPVGVVYLQGQRDAQGFLPFEDAVLGYLKMFTGVLATIAELLLRRLTDQEVTASGTFPEVVTRNPAMCEILEQLRLVAGIDVHVLLTGASGVGKTLLARLVHGRSKRRIHPFMELNCAAIPDGLLENELFGADAGAHSSVPKGGMKGKIEAAAGGTLFLDEVGELSLAAQAKLLQFLQSGTYYRLGSTVARTADVRIIAATNVLMQAAISERKFRQDLYYRLKVFEVRVPSLSERPEDLAPLALHFVREAARRHKLAQPSLSPGAIAAVQALEWPGNVRELAHAMESAVLRSHLRGSARVERIDIGARSTEAVGGPEPITLQEATSVFQRGHVLAMLESCNWNVADAARRLDIARSYLYTLLRVHGLKAPE